MMLPMFMSLALQAPPLLQVQALSVGVTPMSRQKLECTVMATAALLTSAKQVHVLLRAILPKNELSMLFRFSVEIGRLPLLATQPYAVFPL